MHRSSILAVVVTFVISTFVSAQTVELMKMPLAALQAKADSGDAPAMIQLAVRYNLGIGVGQNLKKTRELIEKAAASGNTTAIGMCSSNGWGRTRDLEFAFKCFEKASAEGDLAARRNLARCYSKSSNWADYDKATEIYHELGELCIDIASAYHLGLLHAETNCDRHSPSGEPVSPITERLGMLTAAAGLCSVAKVDLAYYYENGIGCDKDQAGALKLYYKAALEECPSAMRILASRYWKGEGGVAQDMERAKKIYRLAGILGDDEALAWLRLNPSPSFQTETSPPNPRTASTSSNEPSSAAELVSLGKKYMSGEGIEKDTVKAVSCFEKAGRLGNGKAYLCLSLIYIGKYLENFHAKRFVSKDELAKINKCWEQAGDLGESQGYVLLGNSYLKGGYGVLDPNKAIEFFEKAGKLGDSDGYMLIADDLVEGEYVVKDAALAKTFYQKAARLGNKRAIEWLASDMGYQDKKGNTSSKKHLLSNDIADVQSPDLVKHDANKSAAELVRRGMNYEVGNGVPRDITKANEYYQRAGDLGDGAGYFNLGFNCQRGNGVTKDISKANDFYQKACGLGEGKGYFALGLNYEHGEGLAQDITKANENYQKAGELGCGAGFYELGLNYATSNGVSQDFGRAIDLYQKAGGLGCGDAYNTLGGYYFSGTGGVERNIRRGMDLWQKGGELGSGSAYNNLALCYDKGREVPRDYQRANEFFDKAGKLGCANGYTNLGCNYCLGNGVAKDFGRANQLFQTAGVMGSALALRNLAVSYRLGRGVSADPAKAQELEQKAAELSQIEKANHKVASPQLTGTDVIAGIGVLVVLHALTGGTSDDGPPEQNAEAIARWNFAEGQRLERESAHRHQEYLNDNPNVYSPDRN